jgi:putative transport protein
MSQIVEFLAANPIFLLFFVIGGGYLIGSIRLFGFSLGISAVLFVGIACGALDPRLSLPEYIYIIGLILFVYTVGLQSGPVFFASFKKRGLRVNILVVGTILATAVLATFLRKLPGFSVPGLAGLFCGALTNTPALAASVEALRSLAGHLPKAALENLASSPVVTYGLAYPFGVFGMIFWMHLFAKIFKVDFAGEEAKRRREAGAGEILSWTYLVTNPALEGRTVREALALFDPPGFVLSRIFHQGVTTMVTGETVLHAADRVVAVGEAKALERARMLFGQVEEDFLEDGLGRFVSQRIFVSNKDVIGQRIGSLDIQKRFAATITRARRGDVDFVPSAGTILESGDALRVMTRQENVEALRAYFGDSMKAAAEADFLSLSIGILLGILVGMIPIPLPNGMVFKLGFAGGPLVVSLILGKIERTGPLAWRIPFNANLALRQVGLVLFLASIGTKAGQGVTATLHGGGLTFIAAGALLTTFAAVLVLMVGYKVFKLPMSAVIGLLSGMQTQPACLAYANQQAPNEMPNIWYATVYPGAMVAKIILAQLIISVFFVP